MYIIVILHKIYIDTQALLTIDGETKQKLDKSKGSMIKEYVMKYFEKERDNSMIQFIQQLINLHIEVYNIGKSKPNDNNNDIFDTTYRNCHCQSCVDLTSVRYKPY